MHITLIWYLLHKWIMCIIVVAVCLLFSFTCGFVTYEQKPSLWQVWQCVFDMLYFLPYFELEIPKNINNLFSDFVFILCRNWLFLVCNRVYFRGLSGHLHAGCHTAKQIWCVLQIWNYFIKLGKLVVSSYCFLNRVDMPYLSKYVLYFVWTKQKHK